MITVDSREPFHLCLRLTKACFQEGIAFEKKMLESGDFIFDTLENTVAIERKDLSTDFLSSLTNGRLQNQMNRLINESSFDVVMLAIEGCIDVDTRGYVMRGGHPTGWKWTSMQGILTTIQGMGALVQWIPVGQYVPFLISQYKYWSKKEHTSIRPIKPFTSGTRDNLFDRRKQVLMSLPGIGEDLSEDILNYYTIGQIMENPDILLSVPGVGNKKVESLKEIIRG